MPEPLFTSWQEAIDWRRERVAQLEAVLVTVRQELAACTRDGQRLSQLLAEEEDRTEALEAALHALVDKAPLDLDWNPGDCACCHGESSQAVRDQDGIYHEPDCPIVKGRELLGKGEE